MKLNNKFATDLTSKDRNIALAAAKHIIDTPDLDAWTCFVENSDNIFDFIKQNIAQNFSQVINENNYKNLYELFKIHSFDWDECFIQILLRFSYANDELQEKMINLLKNGSEDEKAYAAKFFSFVPNPQTAGLLFDAYSINYEPLKYNAARALGDACDMYSYDYYLNKLNADDEWEKIDAAQFLQWYGNKNAFESMIKAMKDSTMPEHIAGSVAMLESISEYFNSSNENLKNLSLDCYQHLIDSLAEIWPLSTIVDFEIDSCIETLLTLLNSNAENPLKSRFCALLLKTKYQFELFNNEEYKFNEDKKTLQAMENISEMLNEGGDAFWSSCKNKLENELTCNDETRMLFALDLIGLLSVKEYIPQVKSIILDDFSEEIIFKAVLTLDTFKDFDGINKDAVLAKINDYNLKVVIEQTLS